MWVVVTLAMNVLAMTLGILVTRKQHSSQNPLSWLRATVGFTYIGWGIVLLAYACKGIGG